MLDPSERRRNEGFHHTASTHRVINSIIYQNRARLPVPHCSAICLGGNYNYDNYLHSLLGACSLLWLGVVLLPICTCCCMYAYAGLLGVDNDVEKHYV